ncbi:hypothetical protein HYW21_05320 [Candidatus Woesearchaeota archaeon]|nr:hypothetical protein [Candidatus Woesearchaeota archaeon]
MGNQQVIDEIKQQSWEFWLYRPFPRFLAYLLMCGTTQAAYKRIRLPGEMVGVVFDNAIFYKNKELFAQSAAWIPEYFKHHTLFDITHACEQYYAESKPKLISLVQQKKDPFILLEEYVSLIMPICTYIWVTNTLEVYYDTLAPKKVKEILPDQDVEAYLREMSFPPKKNAHNLFYEALANETDLKNVCQEFAWIKGRGRFPVIGYTLEEVRKLQHELQLEQKEELKSKQKQRQQLQQKVQIPALLQPLAAELQEMVYFRLFRSDVFFEFLYLANPLFARVASALALPSIEDVLHTDLLCKKPHVQTKVFAVVKYKNELFLCDSFMKNNKKNVKELSGMIAHEGHAIGKVKIVLNVYDIGKVQQGDILVSNMTLPSYLPAMQRAAAFVTDEGGITCHASIVAREMGKPCIIGTKQATRIFKEGDLIEVDAIQGKVRKKA